MITYKQIQTELEQSITQKTQSTITGYLFHTFDIDADRIIKIVELLDINYSKKRFRGILMKSKNINEEKLNELLIKIESDNIGFELFVNFNLEFEGKVLQGLTTCLYFYQPKHRK